MHENDQLLSTFDCDSDSSCSDLAAADVKRDLLKTYSRHFKTYIALVIMSSSYRDVVLASSPMQSHWTHYFNVKNDKIFKVLLEILAEFNFDQKYRI